MLLQVVIVLDEQIWPDDFFDVVCPGGFIPEFWVVDRHATQASEKRPLFGIVGFVAGLRAEAMKHMREAAIISNTLTQLDEIFGESAVVCLRVPKSQDS